MHKQRAVSNAIRPNAIFIIIFSSIPKLFSSVHMVRQNLSCNSTNLTYLVYCKKCNLQYVGPPLLNSKLDLGIRKELWKQTRKPVRSPYTYTSNSNKHTSSTRQALVKHSSSTRRALVKHSSSTRQTLAKLLITKKAYSSGVRNYFPFHLLGLIKERSFTLGVEPLYLIFSGFCGAGLRVSWSRF